MQNVVTAQVVLILNFAWILFLNLSEVFTWWTQTELLALAGLEIADWADFCRLNMNHGGVDLDSLWTSAVILRFVGVHSLTSIILLLKFDSISFFSPFCCWFVFELKRTWPELWSTKFPQGRSWVKQEKLQAKRKTKNPAHPRQVWQKSKCHFSSFCHINTSYSVQAIHFMTRFFYSSWNFTNEYWNAVLKFSMSQHTST